MGASSKGRYFSGTLLDGLYLRLSWKWIGLGLVQPDTVIRWHREERILPIDLFTATEHAGFKSPKP